jgi:hypothetical protein
MNLNMWIMMGCFVMACQAQKSLVPNASEEKGVAAPVATGAPNESSAAAGPSHNEKTTPPTATAEAVSAITQTFFVVQSRASENTYKVYGTALSPKHTLITATGFAYAKLISTGAEEVNFQTNFVEPSEDPAENMYTETVPYGLYEVDRKVTAGRGLSTPGHVSIDSSTGVDFKPIDFGETHPDYAAITQAMQSPDFQSVHEWKSLRHVKTDYCHYLFDQKTRMLVNCPDYATGGIFVYLVFKSGGSTYVFGESPAKGARNYRYVLTQTGEGWTPLETICHQCSE